ncbi:MAG: hypothetical protein GX591_10930 [Planctomycetes bacterium]|nr:hypothetical protein [Planctomycetota bacterium]
MSDFAPLTTPPERSDERQPSVPCIACGYDLRGLAPNDVCPECGTPVRDSLEGDFLPTAPPRYVRRLARGAILMLCGTLLTLAGILLAVGALVAYANLGIRLPAVPWIAALSALAGCLSDLCGAWLIGSRDPRHLWRDGVFPLRRVVRGTALLAPALEAWLALGAMAHPVGGRALASAPGPLLPILVLLILVWLVGQFARLAWCRRLAMRIPDEALARQTRRVFRKLGLVYAMVPLLMIFQHAASRPPAGLSFLSIAGLAFVHVSKVVFGVAWLLPLLGYCRRFAQCATAAQQRRP